MIGTGLAPTAPPTARPALCPAGGVSEFAVGDDLTPLERDELLPDGELECGAGERDRDVEVVAGAGEVLVELRDRQVGDGVGAFVEIVVGEGSGAFDRERDDRGTVADDLDAADGRVDAPERDRGGIGGGHGSSVIPAADADRRESDIAER